MHRKFSFLGSSLAMTIAIVVASSLAFANPIVNSTSGVFQHGQTITVSGSNFGSHPNYNSSSLTWKGRSFLNFRFRDFENNVIQSDGFTLGFTGSYTIQNSGARPGSNFYGQATYANDEERVWYSAEVQGAPTGSGVFFTSLWFTVSQNTQSGKFFRHYMGPDFSRDDFYLSTGCDDYYIRGGSEAGGSVEWGTGTQFTPGTWSRVDILEQVANNSMIVTIWKDGVQQWSHSDWGGVLVYSPNGHSLDFPNMIDQPGSSRCSSHPTWNGSYKYDDIYISFTQARVEICDNATWISRRHCEIQIPQNWSATSITISANKGSFVDGTTAYLYVMDSTGNVNSAGIAVVIGGSAVPPSAPTNLRLN